MATLQPVAATLQPVAERKGGGQQQPEPEVLTITVTPDGGTATTYTGDNAVNEAFGKITAGSNTVKVEGPIDKNTISAIQKKLNEYSFDKKVCLDISNTSGLTKLDGKAFKDSYMLENVKLPDGMTEIGDNAFDTCTKLTEITIPQSVTKIGSSVFSGCSKLTEITIPKNVTYLGRSSFYNCTKLTKVKFEETEGWESRKEENYGAYTSIDVKNAETNAEKLTKSAFSSEWGYLFRNPKK